MKIFLEELREGLGENFGEDDIFEIEETPSPVGGEGTPWSRGAPWRERLFKGKLSDDGQPLDCPLFLEARWQEDGRVKISLHGLEQPHSPDDLSDLLQKRADLTVVKDWIKPRRGRPEERDPTFLKGLDKAVQRCKDAGFDPQLRTVAVQYYPLGADHIRHRLRRAGYRDWKNYLRERHPR